MKIYQLNFFKGKDLHLSMMYTSKKAAQQDVDFFSRVDFTDIWMRVYIPHPACPGCMQIESNECVWEK